LIAFDIFWLPPDADYWLMPPCCLPPVISLFYAIFAAMLILFHTASHAFTPFAFSFFIIFIFTPDYAFADIVIFDTLRHFR
jgi:hypothetical protein